MTTADAVHDAEPVNRQVDAEQVGLFAAERVFGAEAEFDARGLLADKGEDVEGQV